MVDENIHQREGIQAAGGYNKQANSFPKISVSLT
jgi:hypothetical protein